MLMGSGMGLVGCAPLCWLQLLLGTSAACNPDGSVLLVAAGGLAAAAHLAQPDQPKP
jgi:hypothetical protein